VVRDVLLRRPERVDELVHGPRPDREPVDLLDAQRLAEDAQALGNQLRRQVCARLPIQHPIAPLASPTKTRHVFSSRRIGSISFLSPSTERNEGM
jgi:hypothetical protein